MTDKKKPMFQRRHYDAVARILFKALNLDMDKVDIATTVVGDFEDMFAADNGNFQSERFRKAVFGE